MRGGLLRLDRDNVFAFAGNVPDEHAERTAEVLLGHADLGEVAVAIPHEPATFPVSSAQFQHAFDRDARNARRFGLSFSHYKTPAPERGIGAQAKGESKQHSLVGDSFCFAPIGEA